MDVLAYWEPDLALDGFKQGNLASSFWVPFLSLVKLCHSFRYWDQAAKTSRRAGPPASLYPETRYSKDKRKREWSDEIRKREDHKYRAAYLAAETLAEICKFFEVGTSLSPEGPEWKCYLALRLAIEPFPRHERGHYCAAAFDSFDAVAELLGEPEDIARRWRAAVGDPL